jgi:hypothetical protein
LIWNIFYYLAKLILLSGIITPARGAGPVIAGGQQAT